MTKVISRTAALHRGVHSICHPRDRLAAVAPEYIWHHDMADLHHRTSLSDVETDAIT